MANNNSEKENLTNTHASGSSGRHKKYSRHRTSRSECDHLHQSIDVPSTSTGITAGSSSNNPIFRVIEQDSDEETSQPNTANCDTRAAPADNFVNILPTPLNGSQDMYINVLEIANTNVVANNLRGSSEFVTENYSSLSDSDYEIVMTPVKQRRTHLSPEMVDSGFATGPCTSSGSKPARNRRHQCDTSDDEYKYEKFRKRVKKARLNMRKQIGIDSDSN